MRIKTKDVEAQPRSEQFLKTQFLTDNALATMVHGVWVGFRQRQLIRDLERRIDDERFLNDVGITKQEVENQLAELRRQKFF
ncbi:hypothetical protein [Enterovibrio paralichthyis]|uniref:hypothetical protein n=1 Tax=Enterovibrio paralichthyis TaxID=2853805 RepID=UPI0006CFFC52|nr:hypothetical protein [Enterovibrio paralichthyis]MBV7296540.1 hypothetical protein [Enterovibrio paralichthyis]